MQPPVVQSLDDILATLQPGYAGQEAVYNSQIAALPGQEAGAIQGLDVAKGNAFTDINRGANAKGLAFSGIPIEEQGRYIGEKYLPAVANLKNETQNKTFTLQQALAGLGTEKRNMALSTQQSQKKSLDDYNAQELAYQRQVDMANKQYEQDMAKLREEQSFTAGQNALGRSASAAGNAQNPSAAATQLIMSKIGRDGFVSPSTFEAARKMYVAAGGSASQFAKDFWSFTGTGKGQKNQANWKSYYYG
jgi:hypothetical protein